MKHILIILLACSFIPFNNNFQTKSKAIVATVDNSNKKPLSRYTWGFNTQLMRGPSWLDKDFINAVAKLQPQILRYPGGTNANYWNWQTGWLKLEVTHRSEWKSLPPVPYKLEDLKVACDVTGATPVFVLNMLTSDIEEQLLMLHQAQQMQIPVKFIELGNEFYLEDPDHKATFTSAKAYAETANKFISAIKKDFRDAQVAVVGNSLRDGQLKDPKLPLRFLQWNKEIYANVIGADAITFHVYGGSGLELIPTNEKKIKHNQRSQYTRGEQQVYQSAFDADNGVSVIMGMPFMRNQMFIKNDVANVPQGWKVWITEYNLFENEGIVAGTWAHGLYAACQGMLLMTTPKTDLICYHDISHGAQFGAIFNNNNGFNGFFKNKPTTANAFSASGYTLQLIGEILKEKNEMAPLHFSNTIPTKINGNRIYPSLSGYIFNNKNKKGVLLFNLSGTKTSVDLTALNLPPTTFKQISSNPHTQVTESTDLNITSGNTGPIITLEPYSITNLE